MKISNGLRTLEVPRGAYEETYKAQGYTPLPEEIIPSKEATYTGGSPYAILPVAALRKIAENRGMTLDKGVKKAQLVEVLTQSDAAEKETHEPADKKTGGEGSGSH